MVDLDAIKDCMLFHEKPKAFFEENFDLKRQKFIQFIDTFYYVAYVDADFSFPDSGKDPRVDHFRSFFRHYLELARLSDDVALTGIPHLPLYYTVRRGFYGKMYNILLHRPEHYVIYFADQTFNSESPAILVQIESRALWMDGIRESILQTMSDLSIICDYFDLNIVYAHENRIDFCWHTNYLKNPAFFMRSDNFAKMLLSKLRESFTHDHFFGNDGYDIDYRTLGVRRSNNIFFRFYNKAKEVVEHKNGDKGYFLKLWLLNGLINRYDFYVLERAFIESSWDYRHKARLEFYLEHGTNEVLLKECSDILSGKKVMNIDSLIAFADMLTPKPTEVYNVEFQTMRRFYSSLELEETEANIKKYGVFVRIFTVLDDWKAICNTLTGSVVRLVEPQGDINKSRRPDCNFWDRLRHSRTMDMKHYSADGKILRTYNQNRNADILKKRCLSSIVSWNLYKRGDHLESGEKQIIDFLNSLNEEDYRFIFSNQRKKILRADYSNAEGLPADLSAKYHFLDEGTGEYID